MTADYRIVDFDAAWRDDFARLNIDWLERFFVVEAVDREVLHDPETHILKPGGRIYLLEFRAEDPRVPIKPLHKMTEAQARLELESAGFRFLSNRRQLPWQHFLVFEKP